jgi:branched-chain amino acid transport system permease protein
VTLETVASVLASALVLGSLYALMAAGLSLVWTTLGIFNFTHGVFMTIAAYVAWQVGNDAGLGLGAAAGIAVAISALAGLGCIAERLLIRPFLGRENIVMIAVITTLAALTFLENTILLVWGPRLKELKPLATGTVGFAGATMSAHQAIIVVVAPLVLVGLWIVLKHFRIGAAVRAVGQNREAALLIGLSVERLYMIAFAASAILAAIAGILLGAMRPMTPTMGAEPLVKALIVAIFGGLGSIGGTIGGAYVIGLIEAISTYWVGLYWTPAVLFAVMIAVLLWRPTGLFGGG